MSRKAFSNQCVYGISNHLAQELEMVPGRHFWFHQQRNYGMQWSYKLLILRLVVNAAYLKKIRGMAEELSLAAYLPKGNLIRVEMGGKGIIELQCPWPQYLRTSPKVSQLPTLPGCQSAVGLTTEDRPATVDFDNPLTAHALISGLTGSGKTNLARVLICKLAQQNASSDLRFLLFDVADSGLAWSGFDDLPHLYHGIIDTMPVAREGMAWLQGELDRRAQERTREPKLIVGIDECQVFAKEPDISETLEVLSQRGRKWGISLVLMTQRPVKESLSTTVKANCGIKVVGKVSSPQESAWASGLPDIGGETLGGLGDMLLCKHSGGVQRIASPLFTDQDLDNLPRNGRDWVDFPKPETKEPTNGSDPDFSTQECILSLITARHGRGRPFLKDVLESETGHKPGSSRARRLLQWGQEAHELLAKYRYSLSLTD